MVLGEKHPDYAKSLNNLAWVYTSTGAYAKAEALLRQVLAIRKQAVGEKDSDYAESLHSLALLYMSQGQGGVPSRSADRRWPCSANWPRARPWC